MKTVAFTLGAIALLRSAVASLPHQNNHDRNNDDNENILLNKKQAAQQAQLVYQPAESSKPLQASTEYIEIAIASPQHSHPLPKQHDHLHQNPNPSDNDHPQEESALLTPSPSPADPYTTHHIGTSGPKWGIVYHPYNSDTTCKTRSQVSADMAAISAKGFTTIRLHATDCSILSKLTPALTAHSLKLILGIHIDDEESTLTTGAPAQLADIITWATRDSSSWEHIELIVIGEETIFNDYTTASSLASFISSSTTALRQAGYTGPVTTTEPLPTLSQYSATLCPVLSIAASNIHPFFHADVAAEEAGEFVEHQLAALEEICPGLQGVSLETGWPWRSVGGNSGGGRLPGNDGPEDNNGNGRSNGRAVPGVWEQRVALTEVLRVAGGRTVVVGFEDDGWRDEGELGVEGSWGFGEL